MKKYNKFLAVFFAFCFAFTSLVYASDTAASGDGEEVCFTMWDIETTDPIKEAFQDSIKRYSEANPGYTFVHEPIQNEDYKQKIVIALGADTAPDIFVTWTGGGMVEYINSGDILPLTEYMNKDNYKDRFFDAGIDMATYDGEIWAVPVVTCAVIALACNKKLFDEYGLELPKTLDEFEAACDVFVENGIVPLALANKAKFPASMHYMYLVTRYGGLEPFANAANRTGGSFEDETFQWASEKYRSWAEKGYLGEGFNGLDGEAHMQHQMFFSGEAAMLCEVMDPGYYASIENEVSENMVIIPFPIVEGGKGDPNTIVGSIGSTFYCINADCKDPEMAFEAIKYLVDDQCVDLRIAAGQVPPVKSVYAENPFAKTVLDIVNNATGCQLYYDQYLGSAMAEVHKDNLQAMIGLDITAEEYNHIMESEAQKYAGE